MHEALGAIWVSRKEQSAEGEAGTELYGCLGRNSRPRDLEQSCKAGAAINIEKMLKIQAS